MWLKGGPRMRMRSVIMRVCVLGVCVNFWVEFGHVVLECASIYASLRTRMSVCLRHFHLCHV